MTVEDLAPPGNRDGAHLRSPDARVALHWWARHADESRAAALEPVLSAAERQRAARFGSASLRARYVIGRASLRAILAAHLGVDAADVPIVRGRRGRPCLAGHVDVDFNVSHTDDAMLVGIARGVVVGVDVERADRPINVAGIARRCLTANERDALGPPASDAARLQTLRYWTCKEAMSKATGDGLAAPFRALDVDLAGTTPRLRAGPGPYAPAQWSLHALDVPHGWLATLAIWTPERERD